MDAVASSDALHARVQALISREEADDALVLDVARHQAAHCAPIARLYRARGLDPARLTRVAEIPAVPTDAFKRVRIATHPPALDRVTFLTSGTTLGARGAHPLRRTDTYELAARLHGATMLRLDEPHDALLLVLDDPASSLGHMCRDFARAFARRTTEAFRASLDVAAVSEAAAADRPLLVMSTSFALVHLLDALAGRTLPLPGGSRVMQTGGFKGRSREVSAVELRQQLSRAFAIDERSVVAEYGMTELGSQGYELTLVQRDAAHGVYGLPRWASVSAVDPETNEALPTGEFGILRFVDPVNVDGAVAVQTQDVGRALGPTTFELRGRLEGATPRGCSLAIEELERDA